MASVASPDTGVRELDQFGMRTFPAEDADLLFRLLQGLLTDPGQGDPPLEGDQGFFQIEFPLLQGGDQEFEFAQGFFKTGGGFFSGHADYLIEAGR